jgi:hypothetical protein
MRTRVERDLCPRLREAIRARSRLVSTESGHRRARWLGRSAKPAFLE